ncbi:MAG: hypothetical protein L0Y54_16400, partial [Sporichthyaceae bacterium]|nr:hypothetical protein [Sporichthyaceae bacterium]
SLTMIKTAATAVATSARQVGAWAVLGAQAMINGAKVAAGWLLALGPIGLLIAAVAAVAIAVALNWDKVKRATGKVVDFFRDLPGKIKRFVGPIADILTFPFRLGIEGIKRIWNATIGGKGFTVPDWVPKIGGKGFTIPRLAHGGIRGGLVEVGEHGREIVRLPQGSTVMDHGSSNRMLAGAGSGVPTAVLEIRSGGSALDEWLLEILRKVIRVKGGNVQLVLGAG